MIETQEQFQQAIEQMGRMLSLIESYRTDVLSSNPRNFAVFAEGPLEQLRQLQEQVNDYVSRLKGYPVESSSSALREAPPQ